MTATTVETAIDENSRTGPRGQLHITGTSGDDRLFGSAGPDVISGGAGNDFIMDTAGDNLIEGNQGDDELIGCGTLAGGPGNDAIRGEGKFLFFRGDGHDTLRSYDRVEYPTGRGRFYKEYSLNDSILSFGPGIAPASVRLQRRGYNLEFMLDENDSVTVEQWFGNTKDRLGRVEFANGESWDRTSFARMPMYVIGTPGNDLLQGASGDDLFDAQEGNDFIVDASGSNVIFGGDGNDVIIGCGSFDGGAGNDVLIARGNIDDGNIYYYQRGDGMDVLHVNGADHTSPRSGMIVFRDPLRDDELWFRRQGNDLAVTVVGSCNGVTVSDWFLGTGNQVSSFALGNQKTMPAEHVEALVQAMAQFTPPLSGAGALPDNVRQSLAPTLASSWTIDEPA